MAEGWVVGRLKINKREDSSIPRLSENYHFVDCRVRVFQLQFLEEKVIVLVHESHFLVCG